MPNIYAQWQRSQHNGHTCSCGLELGKWRGAPTSTQAHLMFLKLVTWASQWQLAFFASLPLWSTAHTQEVCTDLSQNGTRTQFLMGWMGLATKVQQIWAHMAECNHNIEWITHWKQVEQMVALKPKNVWLLLCCSLFEKTPKGLNMEV